MINYKEFYSSDAYLEKEKEFLFRKEPFFTGIKISDINDRELIPFSVDKNYFISKFYEKINVFENVCPHMGTELVSNKEKCTSAGKIFCKYHYWSFNVDGSVFKTPQYDGNLAKGLYDVPFTIWRDFLFILPDKDFNFQEWIKPLDEFVNDYDFENSTKSSLSWEHELNANWKIVVDNFQDSYHSIFNHKKLEEIIPIEDEVVYHDNVFLLEKIPLRKYETVANSEKTKFLPLGQKEVIYFYFFPNVIVSLHPDYYIFQRIIPITANKSIVYNDLYFHENVTTQMIESQKKDVIDFWIKLNEEDRILCEAAHRGLSNFNHEKTYLPEYDYLRKSYEEKILKYEFKK